MRRASALLGAVLTAAPCLAQTDTAPAAAPACTAPPAVTGEGDHSVHLSAWRIEKGRLAGDESGPGRELLQYVLSDVGTRLAIPARLPVAFGRGTVLRLRRPALDSTLRVAITAHTEQRLFHSLQQASALQDSIEKLNAAARAAVVAGDVATPTEVEAWPAVRGQVRFTLHRGGRVSGVTTTLRSVLPALDSALAEAVRAAAAAGVPAGIAGRGLARRDSLELAVNLLADDDSIGVAATVARARLPHHRVLAPALTIAMSPPPSYPDAARARGRTGMAVIDFDVRADGTVDAGSIQPRAGSGEFVAAVLRSGVGSQRFLPARAGDCAVAVEVRQPFFFDIAR